MKQITRQKKWENKMKSDGWKSKAYFLPEAIINELTEYKKELMKKWRIENNRPAQH